MIANCNWNYSNERQERKNQSQQTQHIWIRDQHIFALSKINESDFFSIFCLQFALHQWTRNSDCVNWISRMLFFFSSYVCPNVHWFHSWVNHLWRHSSISMPHVTKFNLRFYSWNESELNFVCVCKQWKFIKNNARTYGNKFIEIFIGFDQPGNQI